eukprot:m.238908 g.238908  ORF g.238908 m.238908 type:complete len:136 (+) comp22120_c0_seq1:62-469(+)
MEPRSSLETELNDFVHKFELKTRPHQKKQFLCQANCTESLDGPEGYQRCLESCSTHMVQVSHAFERELQAFQNQFLRCGKGCEDKVKQESGLGPSAQLDQRHEGAFRACIDRCSAEQTVLIPAMARRMDDLLKRQ